MTVKIKLMKIFPCLKTLLEIIYLFIYTGGIIYHKLQRLSEKTTNLVLTGTKIKVQSTFLTEMTSTQDYRLMQYSAIGAEQTSMQNS